MKKIFIATIGLLYLAQAGKAAPLHHGRHADPHKVVVQEVIQTTNYTYLHVNENDTLKWLAVPLMQAWKGQVYYYADGLPMENFESKELHRTFSEVIFLGGVSTEPLVDGKPVQQNRPATPAGDQTYTRTTTPELKLKKEIAINTPGDCITVAEILANKEKYAGKKVKVKGQVTKYNGEIMNKNWIHVQDGTEANGKFDLLITSSATVKTGDIVTFEGTVLVNKDFGYGYHYEVMIEDAVLK